MVIWIAIGFALLVGLSGAALIQFNMESEEVARPDPDEDPEDSSWEPF